MEHVNQYYDNIVFWGFIFPDYMSHILQLMLWGRYAAEGGAEHHGDQHYSITIDIDTHVADEKYQGEIGKFGKAMEVAELGEMDNSGMVQTLQ